MESALRQSKKRFKDLADLLPQMIYEADAKGTITYANEFGFQMLGYNQTNLVTRNIMDFLSPEDRSKARKNLARLIAGEKQPPREYDIYDASGEQIPVINYSTPIYQDEKITGIRGIIIDIRERKAVEKATWAANQAKSNFLALAETAGTVEILVHQIEQLDFDPALTTLGTLEKTLGLKPSLENKHD